MFPRFMFSLRVRLSVASLVLIALLPRADAQDWPQVQASYGILSRVAGTSLDQNANSWLPAFEGGSAVNAELSNPHMAVADAAGNVYIADKESNSILKVTPAGTIHTVAGTHVGGFNGDGPALTAQLNQPNGVFALADGTFYIVDLSNQRIRRVGLDGQMTTVLIEPALPGGRALWVAPDEQLIYYAGPDGLGAPSLKRWTPVGGVEVVANGFVSLGNITVDPNGRPVVTEDTGNRVWRIEVGGAKTLLAGNGGTGGGGDGFAATATGLNRVRGIAFLPGGGFFLATQKGAHIWYVDSAGIIHKAMDCATSGSSSSGDGALWSTPGVKMSEPRAITVAPNGDLLITASDYGQVRRVQALAPPPAPARLQLEATGPGARRLRWPGVAWQSYFIEHKAGLAAPGWTVLGVLTATPGGDSLQVLPPTGGATAGFYRLRMPR